MNYDVLHNFISPVSGRIKSDLNYVPYGDKQEYATPSPILIDIRLDLIQLKKKIDKLEPLTTLKHDHLWSGNENNEPVQVPHLKIEQLPKLGRASVPIPPELLKGEADECAICYLPNPIYKKDAVDQLATGKWLPKIFSGDFDEPDANNLGVKVTDASDTLALTQIKAIQALKRIDNTGFIVKTREVKWEWENPLMKPIPEEISDLYDIHSHYTFTKAQALDELDSGVLYNNGDGVLSTRNNIINLIGDVLGNGSLGEDIRTTYKENSEFKGDYIKVPPALILEDTTTKPTEDNCIFLQKVYTL